MFLKKPSWEVYRPKKKNNRVNSNDDVNEFPWTYLLTASIVELGKDESWFWNSEPRLVINLIEEKKNIDKEKMKLQSAYIACCVWGKDFSEIENGEPEEILGKDKPVEPSMLKGFYL